MEGNTTTTMALVEIQLLSIVVECLNQPISEITREAITYIIWLLLELPSHTPARLAVESSLAPVVVVELSH